MKIKCDKAKLTASIAPALGCVSNKNTMNAIEGLLFNASPEGCVISAYDLEKGVRFTIDAEVERPGSFIINANKLNQIIRVMPDGELTIEVDEKLTASVTGGKSRFELHALDGREFPLMPTLDGEKGFTIPEGTLKSMIAGGDFAVAVNDSRVMLNGSLFEVTEGKMRIIACDGGRMSIREHKSSDIVTSVNAAVEGQTKDFAIIIPGRTLDELKRLLGDGGEPVTVLPSHRHAMFAFGGLTFFTRLIESEYIDYKRYIPPSFSKHAVVDTAQFISALERASLVTEDRAMGQVKSAVMLSFKPGTLDVSSVSVTGRVYDEIAAETDGDDIEIAFNCRFLLDALRCADAERIKLSMNSPLASIIIEPTAPPEDSGFLFLVLPRQI